MAKYLLFLVIFVLCACTHPMTLTDFESGEILQGSYNEANRSVTVTMPDGEVLTGKYSAISNATATFGNAFAVSGGASASVFGTGITTGGAANAYSLVMSQSSKLAMEILVTYSEWNGQGFGEARTNDGRIYKVQF